ncbi:hypothetical protein [Mobilicoccus massiliensis]|uniref:hypothetical protein n=1 Tax=Mobilicoccus massiliensis TaxID=1522310 RepID=UPI001596B41E|nr:hypothetical protein [Mobilicoccus massiliensis]
MAIIHSRMDVMDGIGVTMADPIPARRGEHEHDRENSCGTVYRGARDLAGWRR